ncbi:NB-ARC domain-containing protein [Kitasatospora sp. NPDC059803]|uniref:NB-ARC domain-containing protein n=1 Tax=Kitasatospora sp. NPDC059803 TaxID=3346953 RepID=UPI0036600D99
MSGTDTARGMGFQAACALLQLIRTPEQYPEADTFRVEGADEAIDFEVRDADGRPLMLAQAKTRVEPRTWSGAELLRLVRRWGVADPLGSAVLKFFSDAPVHSSGQALRDVAARARAVSDPERWLAECDGLLPASIALAADDHALLRRLEIESRIGPWERILDQARLELLRLSPTAMAAAEVDSTVDALFVKMFEWSSDRHLTRRTIRLDELPGLLRGRCAAPGAASGRQDGRGRALFRDVPSAAGVRGRRRELAALQECFGWKPDIGGVPVVLSGLGGIGKSSIARLYAHRRRDTYEFVWWIPSDTREDVLASYRRMLAEEQQETGAADESEILAQVSFRLTHLGPRLLLIYDNVAGQEQLNGLLPVCDGADILVTTRDSAWAVAAGGLVVERMVAEEATAWVGERLPGGTTVEVSQLVDAVEGIPLAIAQATGYIAATQCPMDTYLAELAECRAQLLDDPGFVPLDYRHGATLTAAVTLSVRKVVAQALNSTKASGRYLASEVLARCALLAPDFIPLHLVVPDLSPGVAVYGAVAELRRFSLVDPRDGMLVIHRIVQEVVRSMLDGEAVDRMQERFQEKLVMRLRDSMKQQAWSDAATLIEHAVHVAYHVRSGGRGDDGTVALLSNAAGAIMTVHGDLVRSEVLLRQALEIIEHDAEGRLRDPVYRRAATTTALGQCLLNQLRFEEAAEAARTSWKLLERADAFDAELTENLLMAHTTEMRSAVALDRFAEGARANARIERVLRSLDVEPAVAFQTRLEQAQMLVWIKHWGDAALVIEQARADAPSVVTESAKLHFLDAIVKASMGRLEEALVLTAKIPEPAERTAVNVMRHHADEMVDVAHALMTGIQARHDKGLAAEAWILQAAESMIDRAEALLRAHTDAGPDVMATVVHRRAILALTRHRVGHMDGLAECRTLMRESLDLFEAAGQTDAPLAINARCFMEFDERDLESDLGEEDGGEDGGERPALVPLPSSSAGGRYRMSEFPWLEAAALHLSAPPDARPLYRLIGAVGYHLSGQPAPSSAFVAVAFAEALRSLGQRSRLVPATVRVVRDGGEPLGLPAWGIPPTAIGGWEVLGHVVVWCEDSGRLVDPALQLGQGWFAPDAMEREVFRRPVVFPATALDDLLGIRMGTHRNGHRLEYELRPDWDHMLTAALSRVDSVSVNAFGQVLVASATLADVASPHN